MLLRIIVYLALLGAAVVYARRYLRKKGATLGRVIGTLVVLEFLGTGLAAVLGGGLFAAVQHGRDRARHAAQRGKVGHQPAHGNSAGR